MCSRRMPIVLLSLLAIGLGRRGRSFLRLKHERGGVDAIPQSSRARAVREDVSKVAATSGTKHFRPNHSEAAILLRCDYVRGGGLIEAWPATARIEFRFRNKKLQTTPGATVPAAFAVTPVTPRECGLGAFSTQDEILLRRELIFPFLVGLLHFICHRRESLAGGVHDSRVRACPCGRCALRLLAAMNGGSQHQDHRV